MLGPVALFRRISKSRDLNEWSQFQLGVKHHNWKIKELGNLLKRKKRDRALDPQHTSLYIGSELYK